MAAYGYVRGSSAEQAGDDRTSLDAQRRQVAAVGGLAGLPVARVFEEPGVSGGTALVGRPGGHIGGDAPFGWRKVGAGRAARLEPDPEQQAAIRTMELLSLQGKASRAIAAAVQERHGVAVPDATVRSALSRGRERLRDAVDTYRRKFGSVPSAVDRLIGQPCTLADVLFAAAERREALTDAALRQRLALEPLAGAAAGAPAVDA